MRRKTMPLSLSLSLYSCAFVHKVPLFGGTVNPMCQSVLSERNDLDWLVWEFFSFGGESAPSVMDVFSQCKADRECRGTFSNHV
jgi:hypothetical protein